MLDGFRISMFTHIDIVDDGYLRGFENIAR